MAVVERRIHHLKELWFQYLVFKNSDFFVWRKTDKAEGTANWLRLNITVYQNLEYSVPLYFHKRLIQIKPLLLNAQYGQTI